MASSRKKSRRMSTPRLENLEPRVLLTTLHGGDVFIYLNTKNEAVRVQLNGAKTDAIELMTLAGDGTLVDTPGVLYGPHYNAAGVWTGYEPTDFEIINWPDLTVVLDPTGVIPDKVFSAETYWPIIQTDPDTGVMSWINTYTPPADDQRPQDYNDPSPQYQGASTEIYAIYVSQSTRDPDTGLGTSITMSVVTSNGFDPNSNWNATDPWGTSNVPFINLNTGGAVVSAPAQSGGVLIGAYWSPVGGNPKRYFASPSEAEITANPVGVYPGGLISPGITVSDGSVRILSGEVIGQNVRSITIDSAGNITAVDSSAFAGYVDKVHDWGVDVRSLTVGPTGQFWAINNQPGLISDISTYYSPFTHAFTPEPFGVNVQTIASRNGIIYGFDAAANGLISWNAVTSSHVSPAATVKTADGRYVFGVGALTFKPGFATLYGIANTVTDTTPGVAGTAPQAPVLLTISTSNGIAVVQPLTATGARVTAMAFDPLGQLWLYDSSNSSLLRIDDTGAVAETVALTIDNNGAALIGVHGMAFIGDATNYTLFLATTTVDPTPSAIWYWDPAVADPTTQANAIMFKETGATLNQGFVYDTVAHPGYFTVLDDSNNGLYGLSLIPIGAMLETSASATVNPTRAGALYLAGTPSIVYINAQGMDSNGANNWAVAQELDLATLDSTGMPTTQVLIRVNGAGAVQQVEGRLDGLTTVTSLAFKSTGELFLLNSPGAPTGDNLIQVDTTAWTFTSLPAMTDPAAVAVFGFVGIEFIQLGGQDMLLGITAVPDETGKLYTIATDGTDNVILLGDTNVSDLTALAFDPMLLDAARNPQTTPDYLWAIQLESKDDTVYSRMVQIFLSSRYESVDRADGQTPLAFLFDSNNPAYIITDVQALDFDGMDVAYGFGTITSLDPFNTSVPDPAQPYCLFRITVDGAGVYTTTILGYTDKQMTSIAFNPTSGDLWGVYQGRNQADTADQDVVVTITIPDSAVPLAALTLSAPLFYLQTTVMGSPQPLTHVVGIDFQNGQFYVTTGDASDITASSAFYQVDTTTGMATVIRDLTDFMTPMTSLGGDPSTNTNPGDTEHYDPAQMMYTTVLTSEGYKLLALASDPVNAIMDLGRVLLGGTLSGKLYNPGSIEAVEIGFLWGSIYTDRNLTAAILRVGGGKVQDLPPGRSVVEAGGDISMVDSRANLYTGVVAHHNSTVLPPVSVRELETVVAAGEAAYNWQKGYFTDYSNDYSPFTGAGRLNQAQFLSNPTGTIAVYGSIPTQEPNLINFMGASWAVDWYAVPLMAGQTVTIGGLWFNPMPAELVTGPVKFQLYNNRGDLMDTVGYETQEDAGLLSLPGANGTQKDATFTAPEAGTYFLAAMTTVTGYGYLISISSGCTAAIGGVNVNGEYKPLYFGNDSYDPYNAGNVIAYRGGGVGGVVVQGVLGGPTTVNGVVRYITPSIVSAGMGNLVSVESGDSMAYIASNSNVGKVETFGSMGGVDPFYPGVFKSTKILAGVPHPFGYNNNAELQNIRATGNLNWDGLYLSGGHLDIGSSGSIGVMEIRGTIEGLIIQSNTDNAGPVNTYIDQVDVGGNWGGRASVPILKHGLGGDVRFVTVAGTIYSLDINGYFVPVQPTTVTTGAPSTLTDDSGGRVTLTPNPTLAYDKNGNPVLDLATGRQLSYMPSYSYMYIPVDWNNYSGTSGVIARVTVNGSATFTSVAGVAQVCDLNIDGIHTDVVGGVMPVVNINLNGPGKTDIYYLELDPNDGEKFSLLPLLTVNNNTKNGDIVSGYLVANAYINTTGSIGPQAGATHALLHGLDFAPSTTNTATTRDGNAKQDDEFEPQYGYVADHLNGLQVIGNLMSANIGGSLGDLRVASVPGSTKTSTPNSWFGVPVLRSSPINGTNTHALETGYIGTVTVNSDKVSRTRLWDGVNGTVWADNRIYKINVGDGLADDGPADKPKAGIFSNHSIYEVSIAGPRYQSNGFVYGELNGSIIGRVNQTVYVPDKRMIIGATLPPKVTTVLAVQKVTGTKGAQDTANIESAGLYMYQNFHNAMTPLLPMTRLRATGAIGDVKFSGVGADIHWGEVRGQWINSITVTKEAQGITGSNFSATMAPADTWGIGSVSSGGYGFVYTTIAANGYGVGKIVGLSKTADITTFCDFETTANIGSVTIRNITASTLSITNNLKTLKVNGTIGYEIINGQIFGSTINAGSLSSVTVNGDVVVTDIKVSSVITSMYVKGILAGSTITMNGPDTGYLRSLIVGNGIDATYTIQTPLGDSVYYTSITSAGKIGQIITKRGDIGGTISTIEQGWSNDVDLIQAAGSIVADITVAGNVKKIVSGTSLGHNPATFGSTETIDIWGDLGSLTVKRGDLFATVSVGGTAGTIDIRGTMYGNIFVNGNLNVLKVGGSLGGFNPGKVGQLEVLGGLKKLQISGTKDIIADVSIGDSISSLSLKGGSILGNVTSLYGSIGSISLRGGRIDAAATVKGESIGKVTMTNALMAGKLWAVNGGVQSVVVKGADLTGTIQADHGDIGSISVSGALGGNTSATGWIGGITAGAVTGVVRAGSTIGKIQAGAITNATVSSLSNLGPVLVSANLTNSRLLAGALVNAGGDGIYGTADDTYTMHQANIWQVAVKGLLDGSVVSAGVAPAVGSDFRGPVVEAPGLSSIVLMSVGGYANSTLGAVLADTSIDPAFVADAAIRAPDLLVRFGRTTTVSPGSGPQIYHFGESLGFPMDPVDGNMTITLTGPGSAWFNSATGELSLDGTTIDSVLTISGSYSRQISIVTSDDASLSALMMTSNGSNGPAILSTVDIDGYVGTFSAGGVTGDINIDGGVGAGEIAIFAAGVDVTAGSVGSFVITGDTLGGNFTADSVGSLTVTGTTNGSVRVLLGNMDSFQTGMFTGTVEVSNGSVGSATMSSDSAGSFFRTDRGIGSFRVYGDLAGLVSAFGSIGTVSVSGDFIGRVASRSDIGTFSTGTWGGNTGATPALLAAAGNIGQVSIAGDMIGGYILAGFDPGDAGGTLADDVQLDAYVAPTVTANQDRPCSGSISRVTIGGSMLNGSIAAGISPGTDGYIGTSDDRLGGTSYVYSVVVAGGIYGNGIYGQNYGVYAVSGVPTVTMYGQPFLSDGFNANVGRPRTMAGPLTITGLRFVSTGLVLTFNHPLESSSLNDQWQIDHGINSSPVTLIVTISNGTDSVDMTATIDHTLTWDANAYTMTLTLSNYETWGSLDLGTTYTVQVLDGVMDNRQHKLDGEYVDTYPSGDGTPGGDFTYTLTYGSKVIEGVPAYLWYFGCAPTAAAMLVGYYDSMPAFSSLINGNAATMTQAVKDAIASPGDGVYDCSSSGVVIITKAATPGTGHIGDYAVYNGVNDADMANPTPDLSDPAVQGATGVSPHADNSIADYLNTSQSNELRYNSETGLWDGLKMGSSWDDDVLTVIDDYFASRGYTNRVTTTSAVYSDNLWDTYVSEINADRPVLIGVDSDGDGKGDHEVIGIGYNSGTHQYAAYNTWSSQVQWYSFTGAGSTFGITAMVFEHVL